MDPTVLGLTESLAKPFERLYLNAYWDPHPLGFPTQGWGRLLSRYSLSKHLSEGKTKADADVWLRSTYPKITREVADQWLVEDIGRANRGVRRYVKVPMTAGQEAALTDFAFNLGVGNLQASTLLRLLNHEDYEGAADEFPKWNKAGGAVLKGLTRRRRAEREMFLAICSLE